ncbi:MAG TPA: FtsX-like permease family protein [Acidimicrobiales bacterium]|nr:FtsX-like permease family protein [Acidimicrobiales bacterium]
MTNVAWRNLLGERTRFAISVLGVAFSVVLVVTLRALYWGVIDEATRYVRTTGADLWVAQEETPGDFLQSRSILPAADQARIEAVSGVGWVAPLLSRPVGFRVDGRDTDLFLLGVAPGSDVGWPEAVRAGGQVPDRGQIVIDRVFARNFGVRVGDRLPIGPTGLEVSAVVAGGNAFAYQFAWANYADVAAIAGVEGFVSYFLVDAAAGADPDELARRIPAQVPGTQVFAGTELADRNADNLREGFLPILWVLVIVAFVVGTAIIGLIIYTATLEKSREYGVLKAIGFSNRRLYTVVFQQSLLAAMAGFVLGCLLSVVLGPAIERIVPVFVTDIRWGDIVFAGVGALGMAVLASFIPARPVARLDPAEVFRA